MEEKTLLLSEEVAVEEDCISKDIKASLEELKQTCLNQYMPASCAPFHPPSIRQEMISRIESVVEDLVEKLANQQDIKQLQHIVIPVTSQLSQGREKREVVGAHLHLLIHLLARIHRLLITKTSSTRRELYYEDVKLMVKQSRVDRLIHKISCLLEAPQWLFNVFTTSKGLVYGDLIIQTSHHSIDCSIKPGVLVPQDLLNVRMKSSAKFILVIEKDTIFQKLLDEDFPSKHGPCILITGKGVPDVSTRYLVRCAWEQLHLPLLGLFDSDPYGLEIMSIYRFGSTAMSHLKEELCVSSLRWLGLHPTDVTKFSVATLPLTERDRARAKSFLTRQLYTKYPQLLDQVKAMLVSGVKAEIEGLFNISSRFLTDVYLPMKIINKQYY